MTVATANLTISRTIDHAIVADIETAFDGYRSRIAQLSLATSGTLTSMFTPLGPVDAGLIDIPAIEQAQNAVEQVEIERVVVDPFELEAAELALIPTPQEIAILEFVAA